MPVNSTISICGTHFRWDSVIETTILNHTERSKQSNIPCAVNSGTQMRAVQTGDRRDAWTPENDCTYCAYGPTPCPITANWGDSKTFTYDMGFDITFSDVLVKDVNVDRSLHLGYSWSKSTTHGGSFSCSAPAGARRRYGYRTRKIGPIVSLALYCIALATTR